MKQKSAEKQTNEVKTDRRGVKAEKPILRRGSTASIGTIWRGTKGIFVSDVTILFVDASHRKLRKGE